MTHFKLPKHENQDDENQDDRNEDVQNYVDDKQMIDLMLISIVNGVHLSYVLNLKFNLHIKNFFELKNRIKIFVKNFLDTHFLDSDVCYAHIYVYILC